MVIITHQWSISLPFMRLLLVHDMCGVCSNRLLSAAVVSAAVVAVVAVVSAAVVAVVSAAVVAVVAVLLQVEATLRLLIVISLINSLRSSRASALTDSTNVKLTS